MSEMVDRGTMAALEAGISDTCGPASLAICPPEVCECRKAIRAVIEAMREPTTIMLEAGYPAVCGEEHKVWRAMIDAALKP